MSSAAPMSEPQKPSLGRVVRRGALLALISQGIVASFSLMTFAVLARVVDTAKYGEFLLAIVIMQCVQWLSLNAYKEPIIQSRDIDGATLSSCYWFSTSIGALLGVVMSSAAATLFALGKPADLAFCVGLLAIKVFADSSASVPLGLLGRKMAFGKISSITASASLVSSLTILWLLHRGFGIRAMAIGQAFASVIIATSALLVSGWRPERRLRKADLAVYRHYSPHVVSWQAVDALNMSFDRFFVAGSLSVAALGLYGFARRLNDVVLEILVNAIAGVTLPAFSAVQHDQRRLQDAFVRAIRFSTFLVFPVVALLLVCGEELIAAIFGAKWLPALPVYRCFLLVGMLQIVGAFQSTLIRSLGHPQLWARYVAAQAAGNVIMVLCFVHYGIAPLALALVAKTYLIWGWSVYLTCHVLSMRFREWVRAVGPALFCALVTAGTVYLVLANTTLDGNWLRLASALAVGMPLYLTLSFLLNRTSIVELIRFARP
jgi:teichuronic acid exporter